MAGHSKWSKIKRQKATSDKKRSSVFTKLTHAITVAARSGADPAMNPTLQIAIDKAKAENMPKENIKRAIEKGSGGGKGSAAEDVVYEVYGPSGVAVLVSSLTDNTNRTTAEIKAVLNKYSGKMAGPGSVNFLFVQRGVAEINIDGQGSDEIEMKIIESGADDYEKTEAGFVVYTDPKLIMSIVGKLKEQDIKVSSGELVMEPKETVVLPEKESEKVIKLLEALDELDDITGVNSNLG
jgi:YebC/PmpR family DNA-binding regulatory protein